ncbi:uncharacterized protein LOC119271567 [Triticum dicoccoides]|uniref:uncharacterized protein LOC119271567 n=1 Tax=Triticum dicoccoides TaxID=85692 RepID=UPI00188DEB38|nr:uncharacterized protein LOC119271567 [Triticum dicoccoides]
MAVLLVEAALVHVLLLTPTARRWRGQPPLHAQIIFVSGVSLAIGLKSTVQFFTKPKNRKGRTFPCPYWLACLQYDGRVVWLCPAIQVTSVSPASPRHRLQSRLLPS